MDVLNVECRKLKELTNKRANQLDSAHIVQRFNKDIDDTLDWIKEKDQDLNIGDLGKDLHSVQTLQRKHEGLERDLIALEDKIRQLKAIAKRLIESYPEMSKAIHAKEQRIHEEWSILKNKSLARKEKLLDSYDLQRFLREYCDADAWINSMLGLMCSEEYADDVAGAEALIIRHEVISSIYNLI